MSTCTLYAIVAFWGISEWNDCFKCKRFFFVPNPKMRMIQKSEKAELSQLLYSSPHTNDVFLYFKGYHVNSPRTQTLQCLVLDLGLDKKVTSRDKKDHCKRFYMIDESSLLGKFIDYLDCMPYEK